MCFKRTLLVCGLITAFVYANSSAAEAQLRRQSPLLRSQTVRQAAVPKQTASRALQERNLLTAKVVQLSPMLTPATGPSGAQGIASIFYNDVDTSMNSGNLVVTGLPAGKYSVWLIFFDPFVNRVEKQNIYSELVANFNVAENAARVETALMIGLPHVINISYAKQLVVAKWVPTGAQVGGEGICGAAGYPGGLAQGQAILAANIN